jgi:hypothetical protein
MQEERLQRFEKVRDILESYDDSKRYWNPNSNANFYEEEIENIHFLDKNKIIFITLSDRPQMECPVALLNQRDHNTVSKYLHRRINYHRKPQHNNKRKGGRR